jgi:hypothetical protein
VSLSQGDLCLSCPDSAVELGFLLPYLAGAVVEGVVAATGLLLVLARARAEMAASPGCGALSGRVHSRQPGHRHTPDRKITNCSAVQPPSRASHPDA